MFTYKTFLLCFALTRIVVSSPTYARPLTEPDSVRLSRRQNASDDALPELGASETLDTWFQAVDAEDEADGFSDSPPGITLVNTTSLAQTGSGGISNVRLAIGGSMGTDRRKRDYQETPGWKILSYTDGNTNYSNLLSTCLTGSDILGTYKMFNGTTVNNAPLSLVVTDMSLNTIGRPKSLAALDLKNNLVHNIQETLTELNDYLDANVCGYSTTHDELRRKLLQDAQNARNDPAERVRGLVTTTVLGGLIGGPAVGGISFLINPNQTARAVGATTVGTACVVWLTGLLNYLNSRGVIPRAETVTGTFVEARMRAIAEEVINAGREAPRVAADLAQAVAQLPGTVTNALTGPGYETAGSCDQPADIENQLGNLGAGGVTFADGRGGSLDLQPIRTSFSLGNLPDAPTC